MYGPLSNNEKLKVPSKTTAEEDSLKWPVTPLETSLLRTDFRGPCRWVVELTGFLCCFWVKQELILVPLFFQPSALHHFVIVPLRN